MKRLLLLLGSLLLGLIGFLTSRERAGEEGPGSPPEGAGSFSFVRVEDHSCGGARHTVQVYRHDRTGMEFVLVPAGLLDLSRRDEDMPLLCGVERPGVTSRKGGKAAAARFEPFLIGRTEVTQAVWMAVMGENPSANRGPDLPVDSVDWNECREFCRRTGLDLPTELEWEYACRAGTKTPFFWGSTFDGANCWAGANADERTRPVGTTKPNAFGLHDMAGNVYEWCRDWYHEDGIALDPVRDALRIGERPIRVLRGGSVGSSAGCCTSAARSGNWPTVGTPYDGLRCVARQTVTVRARP